MDRYVLSIYQPDGDPPPPDALAEVMRDVRAVDDAMRAAGVWVFAGGLHPPSRATVVDPRGGRMPITDGPYAEGKEHVGGLVIIETAALDDALEWGRRLARATTLPVEVRQIHRDAGPPAQG